MKWFLLLRFQFTLTFPFLPTRRSWVQTFLCLFLNDFASVVRFVSIAANMNDFTFNSRYRLALLLFFLTFWSKYESK